MMKDILIDRMPVPFDTDIVYKPVSYVDNVKHVSISGVQEKLFAVVENGKLRLAEDGEQSVYIIKPAPQNLALLNLQDMPANEYLTMQIASKVFGIDTAICGMIRLADGHLAYIVRRFDVSGQGKLAQEDVCTLLGRSAHTHGSDYKYRGSYLEVANVLRQTLPLWRFDMQRFVKLVVFNYLFSNGDAHLKNFSILRDKDQFRLSPSYDLLNTSLHISDSDFALDKGLGLPLEHTSDVYDKSGHPTIVDFQNFAKLCGLTEKQIADTIAPFAIEQSKVQELCESSLLSNKCKRMFMRTYRERLARFCRGMKR
ncbi:MAG: HipA domain-containing protein [Paludibacteraceae bacterium]|nr:HipA domain-containing protein [Paludibacteraceae bacterium]